MEAPKTNVNNFQPMKKFKKWSDRDNI